VLKKAGIIVATAAAGLLAVSPLAFAGDSGHHNGGSGSEGGSSNTKIIKIGSGDGDDNTNVCAFEGGDSDSSGSNGLLGVLPILNNNNVLNNVNVLQCSNILNNFLNDNEVNVAVLGTANSGDSD
jgi:hypothetical protein